jgi:hypothetical protein
MNIVDFPMNCCAMVQAQGLNYPRKSVFEALENHQRKHKRNCAMITLSEVQGTAIERATEAGFKKVFEFYNPNSTNMIGIYVKTLFDGSEDFHQRTSEWGDEDIDYTEKADEYEVD